MVEEWCKSCEKCSRRKSLPKHNKAPLQTDISGVPMQRIAMDIVGPLPETEHQNKYILVISDYFTKWTEAYAIRNREAKTIADELVKNFICRFGAPDYIHTNQGRNFESSLISEICKLLGIKKTRTTPYHPQSDGMVESFNRTLLNMLGIACNDLQETWDVQLPFLMMAYCTSVQESTGKTPFSLMFGREARLPVDIMFGRTPDQSKSVNEYASTLRDRLETSFECVRDKLKLVQLKQKYLYDRRVRGEPY